MANYLKADKTTALNGIKVNEYLLTKHNPNKIAMPTASMEGKIMGVTIHNTEWISVNSATTPAEQYTRATVNGNMNDVRVHYYVDNTCAWQNLPLTLSGWHAADGNGNGNRRTIAIECIMSSAYNSTDKKSEDNAARLAAALLKQYGLGIDRLYTHTHWLNVKDGKSGTVDQLNTMNNSYKNCPLYILPHWTSFKALVKKYMDTFASAQQSTASTSVLPSDVQTSTSDSFLVKVTCSALNIRSGAGMNYAIKGCIRDKGTYTIVETNGKWGRLKSGAGWICLENYTVRV